MEEIKVNELKSKFNNFLAKHEFFRASFYILVGASIFLLGYYLGKDVIGGLFF